MNRNLLGDESLTLEKLVYTALFGTGRLKITMKRHAACCMSQDYTCYWCQCANFSFNLFVLFNPRIARDQRVPGFILCHDVGFNLFKAIRDVILDWITYTNTDYYFYHVWSRHWFGVSLLVCNELIELKKFTRLQRNVSKLQSLIRRMLVKRNRKKPCIVFSQQINIQLNNNLFKIKQPQNSLCLFVSGKLRFFQVRKHLISLDQQESCWKSEVNFDSCCCDRWYLARVQPLISRIVHVD